MKHSRCGHVHTIQEQKQEACTAVRLEQEAQSGYAWLRGQSLDSTGNSPPTHSICHRVCATMLNVEAGQCGIGWLEPWSCNKMLLMIEIMHDPLY